MIDKGNLIVISGPSGTGKGTVCKQLLEEKREIAYSVSATTRKPREGEVDGVNYYFLAKNDFEKMIQAQELLEWAEVYGNYYGTPLKKIKEKLAEGKDVLLEIDTQGAMNVKKKFPTGVYIYIVPPSLTELSRRIRGRGTDSQESIMKRLKAASAEIKIGKNYEYVVVNDTVANAVRQIAAIVVAEHCKTERNLTLLRELEQEKGE
ncbi:MAG: guanylate kinase [Selenomonadaceae bacterium]